MSFLELAQCLLQVGDNVVSILDTNRQANQVGVDACLEQLLVAQLAMGVACGVQHTRTRVGNVGYDGNEVEAVHETDCILFVTFNSKGHYTTTAIGQVFLCKVVVFVLLKAAIVYPFYFGVCLQEFGNLLCVLAVAGHAQVQIPPL